MILVFLAFMMLLGVLFGTQAVVVDIGYGMGQQGAMQNAADAGALAAARLLASSVGNSNPIQYVTSDTQVNTAAARFTEYNRVGGGASSSYQTAVEYLPWTSSGCIATNANGTPYVSGTYTASSNAKLVAELGGSLNTAAADQLGSVPTGTCGIRVITRVTYDALFARVPPISASSEGASATAAARVFPTAPPTTFTNVWPITRRYDPADTSCTYTQNSPPCTFWSSQSGSGDFKNILDLSHYSQQELQSKWKAFWPQLFMVGWDGSWGTWDKDWDHNYPGPPAKDDLGNWLTYGWHGLIYVGDAQCADPSRRNIAQLANCKNTRPEIYSGTKTADLYKNMLTFIGTHAEGTDPNLGTYVTMRVPLWRYAEYNIDWNPANIGSTADTGTIWTGAPSDPPPSQIERVILSDVRCFRFYSGSISSSSGNSSASGYYVSCPTDNAGQATDGAPSSIANYVALID